MTCHIVVQQGMDDTFRPAIAADDEVIALPFDVNGYPLTMQHSLPSVFARFGVVPGQSAREFLCAAIAAYAADTRVPRRAAYDRWTRDFALHLTVGHPERWQTVLPTFERLLRFLTGDHWTLNVRQGPPTSQNGTQAGEARLPGQPAMRKLAPGRICLFSGGLDSFIGALDVLARPEPSGVTLLLGHHGAGQGPTSVAQSRAITVLEHAYGRERVPFLQAFLSSPRIAHGPTEITTRGRSILFLALGVAVANGLGARQVIVPENGVISLNVPLTPTRLGSFSTRTTHPHLIALLRHILQGLGLAVDVVLPYRFQTKGEMLRKCADQPTLMTGITDTMSCAHPGAGRFAGNKIANRHCGYCLPCLIRHAAIATWRSDPTTYAVEDLRTVLAAPRGADLRAVKLLLARTTARAIRLADLLVAGPLPGTAEELHSYLAVYRRGVNELGTFLRDVV